MGQKNRRGMMMAAGGLGLAGLLGGAAFVGGTLLGQQRGLDPQGTAGSGGLVMKVQGGGPGGAVNKEFRPNIRRAVGVPDAPMDARGIFKSRKDNSLFVGTGEIRMMLTKDDSGKVSTSASNDGPTIEVVVGRETELLLDMTQLDPSVMESGREIQQLVEKLPSLEAINSRLAPDTTLQVWGTRTGDRITARTVLFSMPVVFGR